MKFLLKNAQDPISCLTHFIGALVSAVVAVIFIVIGISLHQSITAIISSIVFAVSATALYSASSLYHYVSIKNEKHLALRKLDHSMIYVLIAGSYTPFVLAYLTGTASIVFISVIWIIAITGIIAKLFLMSIPRVVYTSLYLIMGWSIIFYFPAFYAAMEPGSLTLVALGGLSYTIGGIIYIIKKPNFSKTFGFHEFFHCFILGGTLFHFIAVAIYIL